MAKIIKVCCAEYMTAYITDDGKVNVAVFVNNNWAVAPVAGLTDIVDGFGAQYNCIVKNSAGNAWLLNYNAGKSAIVPVQVMASPGVPFVADKVIGWYLSYIFIKSGSIYISGEDRLNINGGNAITYPMLVSSAHTYDDIVVTEVGLLAKDTSGNVYTVTGNSNNQVTLPAPATMIAAIDRGLFVAVTSDNIYVWTPNWRGGYVGLANNPTSPASIKSQFTDKGCTWPLKELKGNYNTIRVIDANNDMYATGDNAMGEIGNGQELDFKNYPTPFAWSFYPLQKYCPVTKISGKWKNVQTGNTYAFYLYAQNLTDDWYSWGRNKARALGNGLAFTAQIDSAYPNCADVTVPTLVNPLIVSWQIITTFDPNNPTVFVAPATTINTVSGGSLNFVRTITWNVVMPNVYSVEVMVSVDGGTTYEPKFVGISGTRSLQTSVTPIYVKNRVHLKNGTYVYSTPVKIL